jgi:hypothetical protein
MHQRLGLTVACLFATSLWAACWAGKIQVAGGGQLTGEVKRTVKPDGSTSHAVVRIDDDLSIAVAGAFVRRAVEDEGLEEYRQRAAAVGDDAEAHFQLARWCKSKTLLAQQHFHLARAIDIDPDHKLARGALGYVLHPTQKGWISFEKLRRDQGLVKDGKGQWVLPEVLASRTITDENDKQAKLWIRQLRRLHSIAARGDAASAEAIAEIQAIDDPLATLAIASELLRSRNSKIDIRNLRLVYVRLLGKLKNNDAVRTLAEIGVNEPDALIREEALRQLTEYGASSAVASYLPMLASNSAAEVDRAARALMFFPNPELAFTYVNALVTEQKSRTQVGSGGTDASFGNNGVSGLSQGAKIVELTTPVRHPDVLRLLQSIAPGENYGYDEAAWRNYFATLRNPPRSDLRRDP